MKNQNIQSYAIAFLFLVTIFSAKSVKAQSEFGVKGGALYSGFKPIHYFNSLSFDYHSGFELGLFYKKSELLGPIGFQTEFLYQLKGANFNIFTSDYGYGYTPYGYGSNATYTGGYGYGNSSFMISKQKYHYFTIPVLLTVSPFKFLEVYGGGEIGYMFASSKDRFMEKNNFRAGFALGANLKLGENTRLDFRYSQDITSLVDFGDEKLKSRSFSVSVQQTLFRKPAK
jgi:hypothetical protein